ncbi:MAG: glucokinase [Anaerolineae bacterium]|nr:glucokinase [Gloeobacterales cyanobacterium ES-bin-313]
MILAGDIGGTKTHLALFEQQGKNLQVSVEETFVSRDFTSLEAVVLLFIKSHPQKIDRACFGVAGPVRAGCVQTTNLPWVVDIGDLSKQFNIQNATLINDLEANAHGLSHLEPKDFWVLNPGDSEATGNAALISAGTGLGEAGLFWDGKQYFPFASEGGHADFAPMDALQSELLSHLQARFNHVSWEHVLSGPGLQNIYLFLRDSGHGEEPQWLTEKMQTSDPSATITQAALEQTSPLCEQTLQLFVTFYGAEAGNLALKLLATGGLFIGGGIAPKILPALKTDGFMNAFIAKGRLQPVLEKIPVRVVLNDRTALIGAAHYALNH